MSKHASIACKQLAQIVGREGRRRINRRKERRKGKNKEYIKKLDTKIFSIEVYFVKNTGQNEG